MRRILPVVGVVVLVLVLGLRRPRLVLRLVEGRRLPLLRAGRELRRAPVEHRRQGARRRALQPGADARPGHHARSRASSPRRRRPRRRPRRSSRRARSSSRISSATCCRRCSTARSALQDLEAALKKALLGKKADVPATATQREAVANAYGELIASDVVYAASFQRPAQAILAAGERHRRGHRRLGLGALARAREPRPERQRPVDPVGARRRLGQAVHGRHASARRSTA